MIDIKKFHGDGDIRLWLNQPFVIDGRLIATDGHKILILKNADLSGYEELCKEQNNDYKKYLINMIESHADFTKYDDIKSSLKWPEKVKCNICQGIGKAIATKCRECDRSGSVDAKTDYSTYYDLECATCGGVGYEVNLNTDEICNQCGGAGLVYEKYSPVEIFGINVQARYLDLIVSEPGLELGVIKDRNNILIFRVGEDVRGAIMAMIS